MIVTNMLCFKQIQYLILIFLLCSACQHHKQTTDKFAPLVSVQATDTTSSSPTQTVIQPKVNQIFENSKRLNNLKWSNGYILKSIEVSDNSKCENTENDYKYDKDIISITQESNSFQINFNAFENCCSQFLCEAEFINSSTLNIIYQTYGKQCFCNCLFELSYNFEFNTEFEGIEAERNEITSIVFNGDLNSKVEIKQF